MPADAMYQRAPIAVSAPPINAHGSHGIRHRRARQPTAYVNTTAATI
jgi:hypothetical protein